MLLSQTAEYALRAVVCLADSDEKLLATQQLADRTRVPIHYLSKVLQSLRRAGLLESSRGVNGGFALARRAQDITVLEVVNAVDPIRRIDQCPLGIASHGPHLCALHRKLDNAIGMVESTFDQSTIADILATPSRSRPLCDTPHPGTDASCHGCPGRAPADEASCTEPTDAAAAGDRCDQAVSPPCDPQPCD
jgi:Rrf2 family protein